MSTTQSPPSDPAAILARARQPYPASRKVYVEGSQPGVRVPMRDAG